MVQKASERKQCCPKWDAHYCKEAEAKNHKMHHKD